MQKRTMSFSYFVFNIEPLMQHKVRAYLAGDTSEVTRLQKEIDNLYERYAQ